MRAGFGWLKAQVDGGVCIDGDGVVQSRCSRTAQTEEAGRFASDLWLVSWVACGGAHEGTAGQGRVQRANGSAYCWGPLAPFWRAGMCCMQPSNLYRAFPPTNLAHSCSCSLCGCTGRASACWEFFFSSLNGSVGPFLIYKSSRSRAVLAKIALQTCRRPICVQNSASDVRIQPPPLICRPDLSPPATWPPPFS